MRVWFEGLRVRNLGLWCVVVVAGRAGEEKEKERRAGGLNTGINPLVPTRPTQSSQPLMSEDLPPANTSSSTILS